MTALAALATGVGAGAPTPTHASAEEFDELVRRLSPDPDYRHRRQRQRADFADRYPDLADWFAEPLGRRVGRRFGAPPGELVDPVSYEARTYLLFLGVTGRVAFDFEWLLAVPYVGIWRFAAALDLDVARVAAEELPAVAEKLGYRSRTAQKAAHWALARLFLHKAEASLDGITVADLDELSEAIRAFGHRGDVASFHGPGYERLSADWRSVLHLLHVLLYHRGQVADPPRRRLVAPSRPSPLPEPMAQTVTRYLAARALLDRPATLDNLERGLRRFAGWLAAEVPGLSSWTELTREQVLAYAGWLGEAPNSRTGAPLAANTKRGLLAPVVAFFRDASAWGWEEMPSRPLLAGGDLPKIPLAVPRYIPDDELFRLMVAVRELSCPFQRAALLVARWSGARRGEIGRLHLDCLDAYPDGTPRLRLPAGKTYRERVVPLNPEAAEAIQAVQALRSGRAERGFVDELTGTPTRYLFVRHGTRLSMGYLFEAALRTACGATGLVTPEGKPTISAHRFRHTVGTQLAERGAKLHTIMSVLGHTSVSMALVYAQISDREVLRDYQAVLGPGAALAGPSAEVLRSGTLPAEAVDWLKSNFLKTELELGHCLRLPEEGPCECDLYLNSAKFVTSAAYAPRLRRRRALELQLAEDATVRDWQREVERHRRIANRIECLLDELREPLDQPEEKGEK